MSIEDRFLANLARGATISQDEYQQMGQDLPPELLANALARRFQVTGETSTLVEAARLYARANDPYQVLELCSRAPRVRELQQMIQKILPGVRRDYPDTRLVGKLLDEAFLVIDLDSGQITRFPPLMIAAI